jgi:hypothetical protein
MATITLVLEDGSGVAEANTWTSMEESDAYHAAHGNTAWAEAAASPDDARMIAKIRGAAYIDRKYGPMFTGSRLKGRGQALSWPRADAFDIYGEYIEENVVPLEVKRAQFEAELRELQTPGSLSPDITLSNAVRREKVDVLEVEYANPTSASAAIPIVTIIDEILSTLVGVKTRGTSVSYVKRG